MFGIGAGVAAGAAVGAAVGVSVGVGVEVAVGPVVGAAVGAVVGAVVGVVSGSAVGAAVGAAVLSGTAAGSGTLRLFGAAVGVAVVFGLIVASGVAGSFGATVGAGDAGAGAGAGLAGAAGSGFAGTGSAGAGFAGVTSVVGAASPAESAYAENPKPGKDTASGRTLMARKQNKIAKHIERNSFLNLFIVVLPFVLIGCFHASHRNSHLPAVGTGKQCERIIGMYHFINACGRKGHDLSYGVVVSGSVRVSKYNRCAGGQRLQPSEKSVIVMRQNDEVVVRQSPGIPAGRELHVRIAPGGQHREFNVQRRDSYKPDVLISVDFEVRLSRWLRRRGGCRLLGELRGENVREARAFVIGPVVVP